jgi:hypothetical protein
VRLDGGGSLHRSTTLTELDAAVARGFYTPGWRKLTTSRSSHFSCLRRWSNRRLARQINDQGTAPSRSC